MTLTIYSSNYDDNQNVFGHGMSGKIFLEDGKTGKEVISSQEALDFICKSDVDEIVYCYQESGTQLFKKIKLS